MLAGGDGCPGLLSKVIVVAGGAGGVEAGAGSGVAGGKVEVAVAPCSSGAAGREAGTTGGGLGGIGGGADRVTAVGVSAGSKAGAVDAEPEPTDNGPLA